MASVINISIDQGSKFTYVFQLANTVGLNLANSTIIGSLAPGYEEAAANSSVSFACVLVGSNVVVSLTDIQTDNLLLSNTYFPIGQQTWVYDVSVVDSSNSATRIVQGRAHINPRVTQFP